MLLLLLNIMPNAPENHQNYNIRRAQLREMPVRRHHLHDRLAAQILVEKLRHDNRDRQVCDALQYVAGDGNMVDDLSHVALENGMCHAKGNVKPHVE